jgi:hypothetical protein
VQPCSTCSGPLWHRGKGKSISRVGHSTENWSIPVSVLLCFSLPGGKSKEVKVRSLVATFMGK